MFKNMGNPKYIDLVANDIKFFNSNFKKELGTKASLLRVITSYVLKSKGKQLRPTLVFLSSRLFGEVTQSSFSAAFMVELLHTATLVHDDVVDNAAKRRGFFSVNALWKNKIAVLVGDYYLAKGLLHALENKQYDMLETISTAVKDMSEGELIQIEKARALKNSEEIYFEIIKKKTASLFKAAMVCGAQSNKNVSDEDLNKIKELAELLGLAFQIKDDLLDYSKTSLTGKNYYNDLQEQKITLPLLCALNEVDKKEQKRIKKLLKTHKGDSKKIQQIVDFVYSNKGIENTERKMKEISLEAKNLCNSFPQNEAREAILELIDYVCERKK